MADRVLPEDLILCILIRLPVKSILRFRSVCKPWHNLLSSPEFMKMHFDQFSGDPKSQDFIISGNTIRDKLTVSFFKSECNSRKPRKLNLGDTIIVGCCKGLLCMYRKASSDFFLWNPALNLSKNIPLSGIDFGAFERVSYGFGYDDDVGDFKVVRIVCLQGEDRRVEVEVYSAKSHSWQTIKGGFPFQGIPLLWISNKNDVIVNGNPYWLTFVSGVIRGDGLLWFDVKKLVFKIVPLPTHPRSSSFYVDWRGSLADISCSYQNNRVESIYIWVFDKGEMIWRHNHTFRPIKIKLDDLRYSDNGKFIGNFKDGILVVYDFEFTCIKVIETDGTEMSRYKIYEYDESLVYIEGMKPMVVKRKGKK